tara:strand:+ start:87 stop:923 length:837 start_codon:yes stop_codon:yes gene_type:complete
MVAGMISWGVSWPAAKVVGRYGDPSDLIVWRFVLALLTMLIIMNVLNVQLKFPQKSLKFVIAASTLIVFYNFNYLKGTQIGLSSLGGVIVPTISPLFTYVLSMVFLNKQTRVKEICGLLIGLIGGILLIRAWEVNVENIVSSGNLYFLIGALLWSGVTIFAQKTNDELHPLNFSFWVYGIAMLIALPIFPLNSIDAIFKYDLLFWFNFILISVVALGIGTTAYFITTMRLGSHKASSFMFIVPFSAVLSASIFLGETIQISTIFGGIFSTGAVYLINK